MKKLTILLVIALIVASCGNDKNQNGTGDAATGSKPGCISKEDSSKITAWNKMFSTPQDKQKFDIPVRDSSYALECIEEYKRVCRNGTDLTRIQAALKESVSFGSQPLGEWLRKVSDGSTNYSQLWIHFGIYTRHFLEDHLDQNSPNYQEEMSEKLGKLTVFIWPYDDKKNPAIDIATGKQVAAFNLGELHP